MTMKKKKFKIKWYRVLEGTQESNPFTEYISPNEVNENYIYIQD